MLLLQWRLRTTGRRAAAGEGEDEGVDEGVDAVVTPLLRCDH